MYKLRQEQELNDKAILRRKDINEPPRGNCDLGLAEQAEQAGVECASE